MTQNVGGQAVLEGVMMRGPRNWAVAVRKPDGEIAQVARSIDPLMARHWALRLPVVRGVVALGEGVAIGFALMMFKVGPALLTDLLPISNGGWFVLVEGVIRVCVFVAYLTVLSF